jgi:hypothetical protein
MTVSVQTIASAPAAAPVSRLPLGAVGEALLNAASYRVF